MQLCKNCCNYKDLRFTLNFVNLSQVVPVAFTMESFACPHCLDDLAHLASPQGCQFLSDDFHKSSDFFIGDLVIADLVIVEFRCSLHSPDPGEPIPAQARIAVSL